MRRSTFVRRSAVAATAVSLALLVTACGGDAKDDAAPKESAKAESSAPAAAEEAPQAKVLSEDELKKAILAEGDVEGFKIAESTKVEVAGLAKSKVSADKAECEPLARLVAGVTLGEPTAITRARATATPKKEDLAAGNLGGSMTLVGLASYEAKGAEEALATVRTAGAACAGGFSFTQDGTTIKVLKVEELKVSGGDEATGWTLTTEAEGAKGAYHATVFRQGGTLATFPVIDLGAALTGKAGEYPAALSTAQVEKLAKQG